MLLVTITQTPQHVIRRENHYVGANHTVNLKLTPSQYGTGTAMSQEFLEKFNGTLRGVMKWEKLDDLWLAIRNHQNEGWYIYAVGHDLPEKRVDNEELDHFITRIDTLLHQEHDEDYCGIVYTDDFSDPALVKIFDPNNLGSSCGSAMTPSLPGWVMSRDKPAPLDTNTVMPGNRIRWWNRLWNNCN